MTMKKIIFVILAISLSFVSCKVRKQDSVNTVHQTKETAGYTTVTDITEDDIHFHISVLASDNMQGRQSASAYEELAANYIKERFESLGLKSFNKDFLQAVPVNPRKYFNNCELFFNDFTGEYPADFRSMILFDSLTVAGEVVFAGYGNDSDFETINLNDKWVMVLEGSNSILYEIKSNAKNKGASGLLVIGIDGTTGEDKYVLPADSMPMIKISNKLADRLFANVNATVQEIVEKTKTGKGQNINIPVVVNATIKSEVKTTMTSQNVVSYIEAKDSYAHENDYIVIGAHYDHIGTKTVNDSVLICYGADDNASGVAGILEIAEKMCSNKELKYNVIFVAFGAEELGLVGSRYFCNNPPVPLEKIKLMVNLDMIGRMDSNDRVYINTLEPNDKINAVVDVIKNSYPNISTEIAFEAYMRGSDHTSFFNKKIPVISFTTGLHNDYHKPADIMESINFNGEKMILDFVYDLVISPEMDDCIRSVTSSEVNP